MTENQAELEQLLASLMTRWPKLSDRCLEATHQLQKTGVPPSPHLIEELTTYSRDFVSLRTHLLKLTASSLVSPISTPPEVLSLEEMQQLLKVIAASGEHQELLDRAVHVLDQVLAIIHGESLDFAPLQDCQNQAREFKTKITTAQPRELSAEIKALATQEHPFSALLTLVEQPTNLDDEAWATLQDRVSAAFGKTLAIAASRGKLRLKSGDAAAMTPPTPAKPAPGSDIPILSAPSEAAPPRKSGENVIVFGNPNKPQQRVAHPSDVLVFGDAGVIASSKPITDVAPVGLKIKVHLAGVGDREYRQNEYAGTKGQGRRLEGFQIHFDPPVPDLGIRYMAHLEGIGDTPWVTEGEFMGTRGAGRRVEGFAIELMGKQANQYEICYLAHIERLGDSAVHTNGQFCGTRGQGLRIEGIQVWLRKK